VYQVRYLSYLATARIILLLLPLLFHSYTGTALRCPGLYQVLYWGSLAVILVQMLSLSLFNPESIEAFWPVDVSTTNMDADVLHELRRIWWVLTLSLLSDVCHLVLLMNVRSTAPTFNQHALLSGVKKQPSVYFALRSTSVAGDAASRQSGNGVGLSSPDYYGHDGSRQQVVMHAMTGEFAFAYCCTRLGQRNLFSASL